MWAAPDLFQKVRILQSIVRLQVVVLKRVLSEHDNERQSPVHFGDTWPMVAGPWIRLLALQNKASRAQAHKATKHCPKPAERTRLGKLDESKSEKTLL